MNNDKQHGRQLKPCSKCNCVSSLSSSILYRVKPIDLDNTVENVVEKVSEIISGMEGVRVVESDNNYIHAEFESRFFKFIDDLELLYDTGRGVFDVRSSSRLGFYDFGVNRRRIERLSKLLDSLHS